MAARLLPLAALLLVAQLDGIEHTVLDVIHLVAGTTARHDLDCGDDGGKPCPPDCPDCHCAKAGSTAPPVFDAALALELPDTGVAPATFMTDRRPSSPPADSVYRPPRSHARRA